MTVFSKVCLFILVLDARLHPWGSCETAMIEMAHVMLLSHMSLSMKSMHASSASPHGRSPCDAVLLLLLEGNPELCHEHLLPILRDYSRPKQEGLASIMLVCAILSSSFPKHQPALALPGIPNANADGTSQQASFIQDLVCLVLSACRPVACMLEYMVRRHCLTCSLHELPCTLA